MYCIIHVSYDTVPYIVKGNTQCAASFIRYSITRCYVQTRSPFLGIQHYWLYKTITTTSLCYYTTH